MSEIERRPDTHGGTPIHSPAYFEWERSFGPMPKGAKARSAYIRKAIRDGERRSAAGESVPWLLRETR
jgi:hypothetical protein